MDTIPIPLHATLPDLPSAVITGHTGFLDLGGTRAMTGNLDMGTNDIINAKSLTIDNTGSATAVLTMDGSGNSPGNLSYNSVPGLFTLSNSLTVTGTGTFAKVTVDSIDIDGLTINRNATSSFLILRGQPTGVPVINIGAGDTITINAVNPILMAALTLSGDLIVAGITKLGSNAATGDVFIGPTTSMLAPLNITGDTADIGDRHEGLWMRSKEAAWIVQLNVRGPRLEIGGGGSLDTAPAMSVNIYTVNSYFRKCSSSCYS